MIISVFLLIWQYLGVYYVEQVELFDIEGVV